MLKNDQVSTKETEFIAKIATNCLKVEGDFVELGCYKGDTSLMLAEIIKNSGKKLYLYDSFEGLPEKNANDESILGKDFVKGELSVSKREVKERFLRAGLKVPIIKKAWFSDLTDEDLPPKIAFCFLDGDFYESIRDGLNLITGKLSENSTLIVHDYANPALPGVKKAVDAWLTETNLIQKLQTLDSCAVIKA